MNSFVDLEEEQRTLDRYQLEEEFHKLASLVPTIPQDVDLTELEFVELVIDYIQQLQSFLSDDFFHNSSKLSVFSSSFIDRKRTSNSSRTPLSDITIDDNRLDQRATNNWWRNSWKFIEKKDRFFFFFSKIQMKIVQKSTHFSSSTKSHSVCFSSRELQIVDGGRFFEITLNVFFRKIFQSTRFPLSFVVFVDQNWNLLNIFFIFSK